MGFVLIVTDWFESNCWVKQGDTLSPTLFGIYVNDLVEDVKDLNIGIELAEEQICILIYAEDIVIYAQTKQELQCTLYMIGEWGRK